MAKHRLGSICRIISGSTPKTGIPEYWDGDKKWVTPAELSESDYIINDTQRKLTEAGVKAAGLTLLPEGTVILSSRAPIGKVAIAGCEMYCNQGFKNLVCSDIIFNKYLYWYLRGKTDFLNSLGRGATFKEISKSTVSEIEIDVPSYPEQMEAVHKLEKLQVILTLRRAQLAKLDELVKCRFIELYGDPVYNPNKWKEVPLYAIADVVSGITKGRKIADTQLTEVPYMSVCNVKDGYIEWNNLKTIPATDKEISQYRLLPNDVLMTEGGDPDKVGRGAIIYSPPHNCIHQNHIFRVRLSSQVDSIYFEQYLQHAKAKQYFLRSAKQTTGIASINMSQLKAMPVLLAPPNLQTSFADFVRRIDKSRFAIQASLDKTQQLFDSLMQEYFG